MKLFKNNLSFLTSHLSSRKGFTLIELLIVIAILGILAAGIVVVINPMEKINSANMAKAETFAAGIRNSLAMNLVGEWTFDDASGGTAKDTSGYGNDGNVNGATSVTDRNGQANKAYSFDGVSGVISVSNFGTKIPSSEITIAVWVKPGVASGQDDLIAPDPFEPGGGSNRMNIHFPWDNSIHWQFGKPFQGVSVSLDPSWVGVWGHYVFTASVSKNYIRIYRNGVQVATGGFANPYDPTTQATLRIGGRASNPFQGDIDEVSIYNKALLSYQIQQLYAQGLVKHQLALK